MGILKEIKNYIVENEIEKALTLIYEYEQIFIENSEYWNLRGGLCCKVGEYQTAIGCFEKALMINPKNSDAYFNFGYSLEKLGDKKGAIYYYSMSYHTSEEQNIKDEILSISSELVMDLNSLLVEVHKYFPESKWIESLRNESVELNSGINEEIEEKQNGKVQIENNMDESPLLSIIIPAYNAEKYIRETIESALKQTIEKKEIIIVNDGSTDNTYKIIKEYSNLEVIRLFDNIINKGANYTYNYGLLQSRGKYVTFLDADDIILPNYSEKVICKIERENADLGFANLFALEGSKKLETTLYGTPRDKRFNNIFGGPTNKLPNYLSLRKYILQGVHISPRSIYKRELFHKYGLEDYRLKIAHDWLRHIRFIINGARCIFVDEPLGYYRIHPEGNSQKSPLDNIVENLKVMEIVEKELLHLMNQEEESIVKIMKKEIRKKLFLMLADTDLSTTEIVQYLVNKGLLCY